MREIMAVCRSEGAAARRAAHVLDGYLWRIGDRTWRGKASDALIDRCLRDLRSKATRATAIAVYDARPGAVARRPLAVIGRRSAFGERLLCPVRTRTLEVARMRRSPAGEALLAAVELAALFHDVGKDCRLFQMKLRGLSPPSDTVRHEVISAACFSAFWPEGQTAGEWAKDILLDDDGQLRDRLSHARTKASNLLIASLQRKGEGFFGCGHETDSALPMRAAVGFLILTHHRLVGQRDDGGWAWSQHVALGDAALETGGIHVGRPPAPHLAMRLEVGVAPTDRILDLWQTE